MSTVNDNRIIELADENTKLVAALKTSLETNKTVSNLPHVKSWMIFQWHCVDCNHYQTIDYDNWSAYKGLTECQKCEKAYIVKEPWR